MAEKKSWRDYSKSYSEDTADSQSSGEKTGTWRDYSMSLSSDKTRQSSWRDYADTDTGSIVGSNVVKRVNNWLENHNSYISNYQKRNSGRKYTYEDSYVSDSADWLNTATQRKSELYTEADNILAYIDQHKDYLDADWVKSVQDTITDAKNKQNLVVEYSSKDNDYWSKFTPNKTQAAVGYTSDKVYKEWQEEQKQYAEDEAYDVEAGMLELEELKKEREAYLADQEEKRKQAQKEESFWESLGRYLGTTPDTTIPLAGVSNSSGSTNPAASYDKRIADLEKRIERAKYVQGYEGYMDNMDAEGYIDNSQYVSTRTDVPMEDAIYYVNYGQTGEGGAPVMFTMYDDSKLFGDFLYDYINRNQDALDVAMVNDVSDLSTFLGVDDGFLQTMSKDEIGVFNSIYKNQSPEAAYEFVKFIASDLKGRKRAQEQAFWAAYAESDPFGSSVFSTLISPMKGLSYISQAADMLDDGKMDQNAGYNRFSYIPSTIRSQVSATIENSGKWGEVGSFAYNTGMSMADFLFTTAVSGGNQGLSLAIMGTGAAADATIAAKDRGLEDSEAFALGTIAGIAEVAMEKISLGAWLEGDMSEGALRYLLKNALSEGGEEAGTSVINLLADVIISGDKSEWNVAMQAYIDQGKSPEEAFGLVAADQAAQIGLDALGGIFSGAAIGGGTYAGTSAVSQFKYGNIGKNNVSAQKLVTEGLELNPDSQYIKKAQSKLDNGKNLTGMQVRNILATNQKQITANDIQKIQKAAENRLTELGQTDDVGELAEIATKWATGQEITRAEKKLLTNSKYGARVANELLPENIASGDYSTEWAENIGTKQVNAGVYNIKSILEQMAKMDDSAAYKSLEGRVGEEEKFTVSENGKATIRGTGEAIDLSKVEVADFVRDKKTGKITDMVLKADGKEVKASEIDYADDNQSYLFSAVKNIENITPGDATAFVRGYKADSGQTVGEYLNGIDEAYTYGYHKYSEADMGAGLFTPKLSKEQAKGAYLLGQNARNSSDTNKSEAIKRMRTAVEAETEKAAAEGKEAPKAKKMTITYNAGNGKVVGFDKSGVELTERNEAAVKVAKFLHKLGLGTNFEFFESKLSDTMKVKDKKTGEESYARVFVDEYGNEQLAPAGVYRLADGTIRVDLNAYNGRQFALNALAHELTHFIQQWSDKKYKVLAEFLVKTYEKTDMTMHERVLREQKRLEDIRGEEVSYNEAYDEVVANAMSKMFDDGRLVERLTELKAKDEKLARKLWEGIKKVLSKILGVYQADPGLFNDTKDLMKLKEDFEQLQNIFAEALVEASDNFQASLVAKEAGLDIMPVEDGVQYSYSSLAEAAGFEAVENEDGTRSFVREGKKVSKVTVNDIENSPIGAFINFSLEMGDISKEDADRQKKMFADICTMACKTNDFAMTMQFVGSAVFTGMKANADKQYGTTYDFPSICTKTQAVIDAMSAKMVSLGRGLNTNEIVQLYEDVFASGNPVPCPECYVFSRWIGIGGLLDNIKKYQDYYGNMDIKKVAAAYLEMKAKVSKFAEEQGISFGKAKGALTAKLTKEFNKLTEKIEKAQNQGEKVKPADKQRLAELEPMMNTVKSMTWLESVYFADSSLKKVNPNFRVPDSVLFDLNNGEAFATKYKEAWAFRTTQGAGYGKAITPYAEARLGEGVLVTNNTTKTIKDRAQGSLDNIFLSQMGKLDKKSRDSLKRARLKQKIQAFIGGQRFQSTSDARYENASDYLLAALEMQAMGGMVQVYTKVDGAVPAFSAWGFSINQSLMPLNGGLDADGNVKDTAVGGMKPEVAFENRKKHESAGTITIGVNDNHIRAMFKQWVRDFIIPYHASGGKADTIAEFRRIQEGKEAKGKAVRSTDYSRTQSDKVLSDEVLRWQGKTDAQIQRIHEIRNARIAILTGGNPNMTVVRSNRFLSALYDKLNGGEWDGVKLAKSKVESQIFPNEFWDQTVTYDESVKITKDYLEYCEDLGFLHRFSGMIPSNGKLVPANGYDQNGNRVQLTDLAYQYDDNGNKTDKVEDFFWKVLTDRRMYDNNGKYLAQKVVALNDTTTNTVTGFAKNNQGREYDKAKAEALAKKIAGEQYSSQETDLDSDGNRLSAEQMEFFKDSVVRDAKGKLLVVYHGTPNGSTTIFDKAKTSEINDMGQGIYFSTNKGDASSYMGKSRNKKLYSTYVNIKAPFVVSDNVKISVSEAASLLKLCGDRSLALDVYRGDVLVNAKDGYITTSQLANTNISQQMTKILEKSGKYDGIIDETVSEKFGLEEGTKHIIALDSNQIKLIDNQSPTSNPDIRYSSQETDLDTNKDTAYDSAKKKTSQEDKANGRREETREDFHRRAVQEGCTVNDRGEIAYAFRPIADWNLSESIRIAERNLREKGIQVIVCDLFEVNRNGITTQRMNAISAAGEAVYLHTAMETDPIETAEHEAYHFWKHTQARMAYFAELYKNFDFDSPAAIDLLGKIDKEYIESKKANVEIDVEVDSDESVKLIEEAFAYVTGFAASGDQLGIAHKILRDFDAVKAAWDDLLKKQAAGDLYSSQDTDLDTDGNNLSDDQKEFFEESKVRDEHGRLKVLYHGSRYEAFTEFDISQGVWLTPDKSYAEVYAEMWHSWRDDMDGTKRDDINGLEPSVYADPDYRLYKMYANIKNPADIGELNQDLTNTVIRNLAKAIGVEYTKVKTMAADYEGQWVYEMTRSEEFIELAHQQGFDGFKATEKGKETWCAFSAPNQVKLTTNEVPSSFYDIRYSSQETDADVGYHAGDLGKAESLRQQGLGRDTGHFGTGTYFVGNKASIEGYNSRNGKPAPVETVDFNKYNLFKPKNAHDGFVLHDFLRGVDGYWNRDADAVNTMEEYESLQEKLSELVYGIESEEFGETDPNKASWMAVEKEFLSDAKRMMGDYKVGKALTDTLNLLTDGNYQYEARSGEYYSYDFDTDQFTSYTEDEIIRMLNAEEGGWKAYEGIEKLADDYYSYSRTSRYENWSESIKDVAKVLGISEQQVRNVFQSVTEDIKSSGYTDVDMETADSAATRFMKALGYEGIDVRGVKELDNTSYGSVIYDLKDEDLARKKAIGTARYSTQETDNISNRELLANAFEWVVKGSDEYEMIQEYKGRIKILNEYEEKLSKLNAEIRKLLFDPDTERDAKKLKELQTEAKKVAENINRHDKKLLSLEASEPLRKVIERERKKEAKKTKDHVKDLLQNKKDRAEQTEYRHKIRKAVRDLDKLLNRGNKKQNVKEDMKGFVSKALELADYLFTDHISNDELIRNGIDAELVTASGKAQLVKETEEILAKLYDEADSLTDEEFTKLDAKRKANEEKLRDLLKAQRNKRLNTPVYNLFNDLVTEYASLKNSGQDAVKAAYSEEVERLLRTFLGDADSDRARTLQNMRVADMTTEELWKLYNAYTMVLTTVRDANKFHVKGMNESIEQVVGQIAGDFGSRKIPDKKLAIAVQKLTNKIGWSYEKLYYALDRIGSEAFTKLIMNLAGSENIVMQDIIEAMAFRDQIVEKYGFNNWDVNKEIDREFLDNTGKKFKMTLGQMMSLYAYSRREGAWDHIEYGGFVFGEAALTNPKPADSYKLSKAQCESITSLLTKEQKGYVEDMQKFLSETMGNKGNEVSMQLYGIKMFGEKNYFPIHIAGQFKAQAQESQAKQAAGFGSMSNAGFTHAQNPNAKAPFVLEGFNEVWSDHVNEMSRYHGTVPALEDIRRVMNRSTYSDAVAESQSVKQLMENHFGKEAVEYFDNLYREANSGAIQDKLQNKAKKLLSLFRKNSVAYSLSVIIQQPTALVRAYAMIDKKYFGFKGFGTITSGIAKAVSSKWNPAYADAYNEMLKYAPGVTMAKEIGGFDTATGGSIRSTLLDTGKSLKQKWKTGTTLEKGKAVLDLVDDNAVANLPNVADKIAWIEIWNACKRETVAKHKDLAPNSEAFMQAVGERFTEVIRATQVYDSIFAKSPMLKSKNLGVQMLVSFMNEPNTVANMVESAVREATRGNWKQGLRVGGAVIYSIIFNNVLKSIIYAMRDDDEDETYIEKYIEAITGGMMSDFNALNYIPLVRDAVSLAQGYDVERADMAIVADALDALGRVIKNAAADTEDMTDEELIEFDKKVTEANWKLVESVAAFFGIPVKNVRREIEGVIGHARIASANAGQTTTQSAWDKIYDAVVESIPFMQNKNTKQDKLYDAIISGDQTYLERIKSTYKTEDAYQSAVRKALRENDPRIKEAAQARYEGDTEEYKRIFREIKKEGNFAFDDIMSAINTELSKLTPDKVTSEYTASGYVEAVIMGDTSGAKAMKEGIIATKMANGKTQEEAEKEFATNVATGIGKAYSSGLLDEAGAKNMLTEYADKDEEEAASKVSYWSFCEKHPGYDLSESNVNDYTEFAEPANIPLDVFAQYVERTKGLTEIKDQWGDVEVTKREQVLEVIDSLPLTWQQKDALYLAAEYSESKIWDVPW